MTYQNYYKNVLEAQSAAQTYCQNVLEYIRVLFTINLECIKKYKNYVQNVLGAQNVAQNYYYNALLEISRIINRM